jgi:hypothetical protein
MYKLRQLTRNITTGLFGLDLTMPWFLVCHFRRMKFKALVIWIWNQNIAISTIVGTSSHIMTLLFRQLLPVVC